MASPVPRHPSERRRRNVAESGKADRALPSGGRRGRPPNSPVALGAAGAALWQRLWASPQATLWHRCDYDGVAKRCQLEDMLTSGDGDPLKIMAQIQAWEDRWGFNPRALAQLHLWIESGDAPAPSSSKPARDVVDIRERMREIVTGA
jgi:hypothetical protein